LDDDTIGYGRVEEFFVFDAAFLQEIAGVQGMPHLFDKPLVVAAVLPIPPLIYRPDCELVEYRLNAGNYAEVQLIDASRIVCLVGRVIAPNKTAYIIDRSMVIGQMDMLDVTLNPD
jgi:hypothetical protein